MKAIERVQRSLRWGTGGLGILVAIGLMVLVVGIPGASYADQTVQQLFDEGDWEQANEEAYLRDDAASMRIRSRFALWAGEDEEARRFAQAAVEMSTSDFERRRSAVNLSRIQWLFGEREQAIQDLREWLVQAPSDLEVRYELGWRLIAEGSMQEGRAILEGMSQRYNDGLIQEVDELVWLGRAMEAAERPRDANRAFSRALAQDETHLEANLRFGQLMLDRHNAAEAEGAFEAVLERHADHPEALVGMAKIEFFKSGRFREAMTLLERAKRAYPGHPEVARGRAHLLIAQGAWEEGRTVAEVLLERAPQDGEALSLWAAASYLLADDEAFSTAVERFDSRRPARPELYSTVGEFAALNNRHRASIDLFEKALERRSDYAPALSGLGMALTRSGEELRGVEVLERAFNADQFRVPVYNTLELYERGLRHYITDDVDGFRLRAFEGDFDLVRDLAQPLVLEANAEFERRYGVELPSLALEVFADRQAFSVRSVGLPHIDPHGICFGRVVLTRGPGDGNFNWPMVVWHELAHSYHMELSHERVSRWFTEGLAEYETRMRNASWTRFHDLDIARRIAHGDLWSIAEMDEVFMTGRGVEVGHAYHVAMLIMAFLDEEYGFDIIVEMLERFAEMPSSERVFESVLGLSTQAIDEQFEAWLRQRYSGLLAQELVDFLRVQKMLRDETVEHHSDAEAAAYRALVAAVRGDEDQARVYLRNAERRDEGERAPILMRVMVYDALDDLEEGLRVGSEALDRGVEGFDLRHSMSRMAERADRRTEAYVHALVATTLAPQELEGWRHLIPRARAVNEEQRAAVALRELFARSPHSAELARRRLEMLESRHDFDGAHEAALRWSEIAGLDSRSHLAVARTAINRHHFDGAARALERAAMASPGRSDEIWAAAAEWLRNIGEDDRAKQFEHRIDGAHSDSE